MSTGRQTEAFSRSLSLGGGKTVKCQLMNCIVLHTSLILKIKAHFVSDAQVLTLSLLFVFWEINASQASRFPGLNSKFLETNTFIPAVYYPPAT